MKVLLYNDTDHVWKRHAGGTGPAEILPHTGAAINLYTNQDFAFVKVWQGVFLVKGTSDQHFATDVGEAIGALLPTEIEQDG